ncbi:MAG: bifunctional enoyl-CoA hydratase/phosphate acetyltransferase [Alphaproteobacteria bacterium]|nr:bifunctional enoyl-CoA hydratase/phosphate acetyltransferase [Alphaproteobacteria bacterium]
MHQAYKEILDFCKTIPPLKTAVAFPCNGFALSSVVESAIEGILDPILVGPKKTIQEVAKKENLDISSYEIVDVEHAHEAAFKSVELVRLGKAKSLMKGSLHTDELLSQVLKRDTGLRTDRAITHAFLISVPSYPHMFVVTDAAVNIAPDLKTKADICQNAIDLMHLFRNKDPKVAILSAVETVNPKIQSTIDAAALCKMSDRGQIKGGVLDGPLAFDNAISLEAAKIKGIDSPVAGDADILLVPDLEAGNILAKQLIHLSNAAAAGIILGAKVPIILTSRSDDVDSRIASCAVAAVTMHFKEQKLKI